MPNAIKINSSKGSVKFSREDLVDLNLIKWVRSDSKGFGHRDFIDVIPIERAAAKVYKEAYPSAQIKIAEKCFLNQDGSVDVILSTANDFSEGYYKKHPTKMTFLGDSKEKELGLNKKFNEEIEDRQDKASKLFIPINFLEENINNFTEEDRRQIYASLGKDTADLFLEDLLDKAIDLNDYDFVISEKEDEESFE